jgi:thiosulfate/3-mercaptopyruvate sulfurtransferase
MNHSPLISAETLLENLDDPKIKVFDVRGVWGANPGSERDQYDKGHIPGAVYLDWTKHFIAPRTLIPEAPVASAADARQSFAALGISAGDTVVLYDHYNHMFASRLWWAMQYWGFGNVKILDGGWPCWNSREHPVSMDEVLPTQGDFVPQKQAHLRVDTSQVLARSPDTILLDARIEKNYLGNSSDPGSGHIPGAISIPFKSLMREEDGPFKASAELEALFAGKLGAWRDKPIISYCAAGYASSVILVALQILGAEAVLYDDSFVVWKKDPQRPIEQG